ncbi:MAG: hypothetical protein JW940_33595 [Polyangiaceae bacterium]|nr:hypothetical protein [Polyangiaceae bacterium]
MFFLTPSLNPLGRPQFACALPLLLGASAVIATLTLSHTALADESVIGIPGAHPDYSVELEPEAVFVFGRSFDEGPGLGLRVSIPVVDNGFVSTINNNVAISFGIDKDPFARGRTINLPVALQWNFFLTRHWSVLGEPGLFIQVDDHTRVHPQIWGGGRYHFNDTVALMARLTLPFAPAFSIGVSFFL